MTYFQVISRLKSSLNFFVLGADSCKKQTQLTGSWVYSALVYSALVFCYFCGRLRISGLNLRSMIQGLNLDLRVAHR
jgi:hypothetical protein